MKFWRAVLLVTLGLGILPAPAAADPPQAKKTPRIGAVHLMGQRAVCSAPSNAWRSPI